MASTLDGSTRSAIEGNLFRFAHAAIGDWDRFPWHRDQEGNPQTWKRWSSQAIGIDVFGTLRRLGDRERRAGMDAIATLLGASSGGEWKVELEWCDEKENRLRERRKTQIDAVARCDRSLVFFEVKFTEPDGGSCSQVAPIAKGKHKGKTQCDGHYKLQTNPVNETESRCALSGKKIRYWDAIPHVFELDPDDDITPCPFRGPWFQWMRNFVLCHEVARFEGRRPAFVIAYADAPGLAVAEKARADGWADLGKVLRPGGVDFHAVSLQRLVEAATLGVRAASGDASVLVALQEWIERKISAVANGSRDLLPKPSR